MTNAGESPPPRSDRVPTPPDASLEAPPCPCGSSESEEILTGRDRLYDHPGEFPVVRCSRCGLLRTNPRPTAKAMGMFYEDDYGPYQYTRVVTEEFPRRGKKTWKGAIRRLIELNTQRMPHVPPGRLLEVGCASGAFLDSMAGRGWAVEGIEFSPAAAASAAAIGHTVFCGRLEDAPSPAKPFDLVVAWMTIEHLHDPARALKKLSEWTRPGGWLVFSVPNAGSLELKLFGSAWYALHLPNHLFHFSPKTVRRLLRDNGWQVSRIHHHRVLTNVLGSVAHLLDEKGIFPRVSEHLLKLAVAPGRLNDVLYPAAYLLSMFGQTGGMTVWAQRLDRGRE